MSLKVFLELIEVKAKSASLLPFLLGVGYSIWYYHSFDWRVMLVFLIAMLLFNMAVDVMDNYNDYRHAIDTEVYQQKTNIIGREQLSLPIIRCLIAGMVLVASLLGIWLVVQVSWPLLGLGIFCFLVGIFYSFGPYPLSGLPVGEFFAGFTMGFMIVLITIYLNVQEQFLWDWPSLGRILVLAMPLELWISNLLLANNLCDAAEDLRNHRHTIVRLLGKRACLIAFSVKNVLAFLFITISPFFHISPFTVILSLLIVPFVFNQNKMLIKRQVKNETFICAVRILMVGGATQVLTYLIGMVL